ncbi:MAG: DUF6786 family protein [Planctomycetota bacterium]
MEIQYLLILCLTAFCIAGCFTPSRDFGDDLDFLAKHLDVLLLTDDAAKVVVAPAYQGRVMTSTFGGLKGPSLGWVNYDLIASGEIKPHINVFGGEDRFWLGPEGGQFAIFFEKGDSFDLDDWQTPPLIDTEPYPVVQSDSRSVTFLKEATLSNYSGTRFDLRIERIVRLIERKKVEALLGLALNDGVKMVAYESENILTNTGKAPWTKEGGLLSIWILGMYKHSSSMTVVVPYKRGPETELGPVVNDAYFGKVPADRLRVGKKAIFFKGDGQYRSKIGVNPKRAQPVLGSYDTEQRILTLVLYNKPEGVLDYVNSMWKLQDAPFAGDAVNSYNDGPPSPGADPLGPFYELETSSPAAALEPGESITHFHRTLHLSGPPAALDEISRKVLGVDLRSIKKAFAE